VLGVQQRHGPVEKCDLDVVLLPVPLRIKKTRMGITLVCSVTINKEGRHRELHVAGAQSRKAGLGSPVNQRRMHFDNKTLP
jgi:hypothetical protein